MRGAVAELQRAGITLPGVRIEISGTVAQGGGLSSSAALEVALTLALVADLRTCGSRTDWRWRACARGSRTSGPARRPGCWTSWRRCIGQLDHAMEIDFRTLEVTPVTLELGDFKLVTLDSGEKHANAASGYNERRAECARACERLGIESLREATLEMARDAALAAGRARDDTSSPRTRAWRRRCERLAARDMPALGELLNESHASLRDLYEISTPAVEAAVQRPARRGRAWAPGSWAAASGAMCSG